MTSDEALAICSANLKGSHDKDLLATAHALKFLSSHPGKVSSADVGTLVGISGSMVRQFLGILRLPEAVQQMIEEKQLGLDQAHRLGLLCSRPAEFQREAAEMLVGITASQARLFVAELVADPQLSLAEAMERAAVKEAATEQRVRIVVMLPKEQYRSLSQHAQQSRIQIADLASDILTRWLDSAEGKTSTR